MAPVSVIILEIVCPAIGVIIANVMYFAPYQDLKKAVSQRELGDLNPTPWAFMLGYGLGWATYSVFIHDLWLFCASAPGFVLSIWLNMGAAKLQYQSHHANEMRKSFADYMEKSKLEIEKRKSFQLQEVDKEEQESTGMDPDDDNFPLKTASNFEKVSYDVTSEVSPAAAPHETITMVILLIWVTAIAFVIFSADFLSYSTRQMIVGVLVNINLIFYYAAPLSTMFEVIKSRNSASIHICTMITNTANCAFWTAYGFALMDPFVYIPLGVGTVLGLIQLFLCMIFPRIPFSAADVVDIAMVKDINEDVEQTAKISSADGYDEESGEVLQS